MSAIYLSRAGQTYGPISDADLQSMRSSGEILDYAWIFESPARGWEAIHPMPPAPPALPLTRGQPDAQRPAPSVQPLRPTGQAHVHAPTGATAAPPERRAPSTFRPAREVEVVMHDFHHLVTGNLSSLTEAGCELVCEEHEEAGPVFSERSRLVLNLLDPATGRAMNVAASLAQVARKDGHWSYQLRWDRVPEILL